MAQDHTRASSAAFCIPWGRWAEGRVGRSRHEVRVWDVRVTLAWFFPAKPQPVPAPSCGAVLSAPSSWNKFVVFHQILVLSAAREGGEAEPGPRGPLPLAHPPPGLPGGAGLAPPPQPSAIADSPRLETLWGWEAGPS